MALDTPTRADSSEQTAHRTFVDELANVPKGFFNAAVQRPWNGVAQLAGLPEMAVVDANALQGVGAAIGNIAGVGADIYLLSKLGLPRLGNLGGAGALGAGIRMGTIGAVYEGVFQPTTGSGGSLIGERVSNAMVGAITWGTAGATATAINRAGIFAMPEVRSLGGSMLYGAMTGVPTGIAHAEANALFKDGNLVATPGEFLRDGALYGTMGVAFGGAGYALNKFSDAVTKTHLTGSKTDINITADRNGNVLKVYGETPGRGGYSDRIHESFDSVRKTDGTWSSRGTVKIDNAVLGQDGSLNVAAKDGMIRKIGARGLFEQYSAAEVGTQTPGARFTFSTDGKNFAADDHSIRSYNERGQLTELKVPRQPNSGASNSGARLSYAEDGSIKSASLNSPQQESVHLENTGGDSWRVRIKDTVFDWKGKVQVTAPTASSPESIVLKSSSGAQSAFTLESGSQQVSQFIKGNSTYIPGGSGTGFAVADNNGNLKITGASNGFNKVLVNGQPVSGTGTVVAKPGDTIALGNDVGDRYPEILWQKFGLSRGADGVLSMGGQRIQPNQPFDFSPVTQSSIAK